VATRFVLTDDSTAPAVSPTISGTDWAHINTVRRKLVIGADSSTLVSTAYTPDAADHLVAGNAHHRQYISDPLGPQTISSASTVQAQLQTLETDALDNLFLTLKVYTVDSGGTFKSALLAVVGKGTEPTTALRNTSFAATALNGSGGNVTVAEGDRIVVEIGLGGTPTATSGVQGHNGTIRWGCNASSGDLPVDETQAATTYRPWVEFSANLLFLKTFTNSDALGSYADNFNHSRAFNLADGLGGYADALQAGIPRRGWGDAADASTGAGANITVTPSADDLNLWADQRNISTGSGTLTIAPPADALGSYADSAQVLRGLTVSTSDSLGLYTDALRGSLKRIGWNDQLGAFRSGVSVIAVNLTADVLGSYADSPAILQTIAVSISDSLGIYADQTPTITAVLTAAPAADSLAAYADTSNQFVTLGATPSDDLNLWVDQRNISTGAGALTIAPLADSLGLYADPAPTIIKALMIAPLADSLGYADASNQLVTFAATASDNFNQWADQLTWGLAIAPPADTLGLYADQTPTISRGLTASLAADSLGLYADQAPTIALGQVLNVTPAADSLAAYGDSKNQFSTIATTPIDDLNQWADQGNTSTAAAAVNITPPADAMPTPADQAASLIGKLATPAADAMAPGDQLAGAVRYLAQLSDTLANYGDQVVLNAGAQFRVGWSDSVIAVKALGAVKGGNLSDARPAIGDSFNIVLDYDCGFVLYLVDDGGNYIVDENGNRIAAAGLIDNLQQGDSIAITRTTAGTTPKAVSLTDALAANDAITINLGVVTLQVSLTDALGSYADALSAPSIGALTVSSTDGLGGYNDSTPFMTTSGELRVSQSDALPVYSDSIQVRQIGVIIVSLSDALGGYNDPNPAVNTSGGLLLSQSDAFNIYSDSIQVQQSGPLFLSLSEVQGGSYSDALTINLGILKAASDNLASYADSPAHGRGLVISPPADGLTNYLDVITRGGSGQLQAALSDNLGQYNDAPPSTFANFRAQLPADGLAYADSLSALLGLTYNFNDQVDPPFRLLDQINVRYGLFNELRYGLTETSFNHWADAAGYARTFFAIRLTGKAADQISLTGKVIAEQISVNGKLGDKADLTGELYVGEN
jgi:hypothetical protein